MSNGRIGNPPQTVSTTADQTIEDIGSTTSSNASTSTPPITEQHPQSDSRTTDAFKHRGSEVKSQQNLAANLVKQDLEKRLGNVPGKPITLERDAGNDKFAKIHVQREVHTTPPKPKYATEHIGHQRESIKHLANIEPGSETALTRYPNGVSIKTDSYFDTDGRRGISTVSVDPPPGGKIVKTSEESSIIYDKQGEKVGEVKVELGEDGMKATLVVHSKEGEYKQTGDGQITFTPRKPAK